MASPASPVPGTTSTSVLGSGEPSSTYGSVALSRCTTAHPLHTRSTKIFGASIKFSEATMRPNPTSTSYSSSVGLSGVSTQSFITTALVACTISSSPSVGRAPPSRGPRRHVPFPPNVQCRIPRDFYMEHAAAAVPTLFPPQATLLCVKKERGKLLWARFPDEINERRADK